MTAENVQKELLGMRLLDAAFPHPVDEIMLLETHISWVVLSGKWAYKFKKPVRFDFLDYSSIVRRLHFCEREIAINKAWAPSLYEDVVPLFEDRSAHLRIGTADECPQPGESIIDYAVRMQQFLQSAILTEQLSAGSITPDQMECLADDLAALHARVDIVPYQHDLVSRASLAPVNENFRYLLAGLHENDVDLDSVRGLQAWVSGEIERLAPLMEQRAKDGRIRNCHGDLHLGNLLFLDEQFVPFDGIEFNDALRQIDVVNEIAFLAMELSEHNYSEHSHVFINRYIEATGDYDGLQLLPYYLVYRAMVRAKVDLIGQQQRSSDRSSASIALSSVGTQYIDYAKRVTRRAAAQLWITYGLSGSGKSFTAMRLVKQQGFIRLRSDVIRKLRAGQDPFARPSESERALLYNSEMTRQTYQRLLELAQQVIAAGFSVIVDATFLQRDLREMFSDAAKRLDVDFRIVYCDASRDELQRRILTRRNDPSDASVAVLDAQIRSAQPPAGDELSSIITQAQCD
jgi:uncharacterized protein